MGDHRADIKIELTFPDGEVHKWDAWLNYWPDEDGVDERVKDFFRKAWEKWLESYSDLCAESTRAEQEKLERSQLAALKAKYEP